MRRRLKIFLSIVLLSLLVAPAVNLLSAPSLDSIKRIGVRDFLYNLDFAIRWVSLALYPLGISTDPEQVIIGLDDWLYLGDKHDQTRSATRRPPTESDMALGKQIRKATAAWDDYLSGKGVKLFRIMLAPNKGTIYPEHLPEWAKPASPNATDALFAGEDVTCYIDLRAPLIAAKATHQEALYNKTDTHWNFLAVGLAFQFFAQQVSPAAPELRWPSEADYAVSRIVLRKGGDLARFLRLEEDLSDSGIRIHALDLQVETTQYDYDTRRVIHKGGNPRVGTPAGSGPKLVISKGALNKRKVLWLRDSFGDAISPLMAITFSDVLQLHWLDGLKPGGRLVQLVEDWKPDYVFFTVVERASMYKEFATYPPSIITQ